MVTSNKIAQQFSISVGNILFKNFFPVYNIIYPVFKRMQDADEIEFLKRNVKKGDIVLDIGANIGFYSKILSELVGLAGKVYCFEPDKKNYNYFLKNTKGIANVFGVNKAVADQTKTLKLYTSKLLNVDHRTYKVDEFEQEITIDAVSIDDFVGDKFKVDFIKMDIQGFEVSAIKGMQKILSNNPSLKLLTELWPYGLRKAGCSCAEMVNLIEQYGYRIYELVNKEHLPLTKEKISQIENLEYEFGMNVFITREHF